VSNLPSFCGSAGKPARLTASVRSFFDDYATRAGLEILPGDAPRGLLQDLTDVLGGAPIHSAVAAFYERTSEYHMDCWSEWSSVFRPFGRLLALMFSRRLEQLNMPLAGLDTHRGISSRVLVMRTPQGHLQTGWVRQLLASKRTLYAGSYSTCWVPGYASRSAAAQSCRALRLRPTSRARGAPLRAATVARSGARSGLV
jgi:hypothetical protein